VAMAAELRALPLALLWDAGPEGWKHCCSCRTASSCCCSCCHGGCGHRRCLLVLGMWTGCTAGASVGGRHQDVVAIKTSGLAHVCCHRLNERMARVPHAAALLRSTKSVHALLQLLPQLLPCSSWVPWPPLSPLLNKNWGAAAVVETTACSWLPSATSSVH